MKRPFQKQNDRIVQAPQRPRALRILTGLFLTGIAVSFIAAMGVVDYQSRSVGWNQRHTEFALSVSDDTLQITVLGVHGAFALHPVYQCLNDAKQYQKGIDIFKPAPVWLAQSTGFLTVRAESARIQRTSTKLLQASGPMLNLARQLLD